MCPTALRRSLRCLLGRWVFDAHDSSSPQCNKAPLWPLSRTKMLELKRFVFHFLTRTPDLGFGISGGVTASGMGLQTLRSFVLSFFPPAVHTELKRVRSWVSCLFLKIHLCNLEKPCIQVSLPILQLEVPQAGWGQILLYMAYCEADCFATAS